jgi:hypothetical protein
MYLGVLSCICRQAYRTQFPLITADTNEKNSYRSEARRTSTETVSDRGMDNCNSPCLARTLKTVHKTDCVDTLKLNRKTVPKCERHETNSACFYYKVQQQKTVTMISTYHSHDTRNVTVMGKEQVKPTSALDHTQCSGGVDLMDQLLHSYLTDRRRTNKWHTKLFHKLLNTYFNSE